MSAETESSIKDSSTKDKKRFRLMQIMRLALAAAACVFIAHVADVGVGLAWLIAPCWFGIITAGFLLKYRYRFLSALFWHAAFVGAVVVVLQVANVILVAAADRSRGAEFIAPLLLDYFSLLALFYFLAFLSTWYYWTSKHAPTAECFLTSIFFVWLLSGHRNYHIDSLKQLSSLAWKVELFQRLQLEPQHLFLGAAFLFFLVLASYLALSGSRPLFNNAVEVRTYGPAQKIAVFTSLALGLAAIAYYALLINSNYKKEISRVSSGVGENELSFHSAISPTQQPAALVRLETDYAKNPWAPMLYLREGAVSRYEGFKLERALGNHDGDVPTIVPGEAYRRPADKYEEVRQSVVQSIYLLTRHKYPVAIDAPQQITPIKNPYPERFRLAYQALSVAPTAKFEDLVGAPVGDPTWTKDTWEYYLRAPGSKSPAPERTDLPDARKPELDAFGEDLRYAKLARNIAGSADDKIIQAALIADYLSRNSIYTRNPEHDVDAKSDPVAPYLFSEKKRGYCVHFAHAAVYMMRLLGIPARIGMGYLTDLNYAKDGHILLQLGDRHAWPEVYVQGHGWVVFDITPTKAEGEQVLVPDEKLLEELMSKLDPAQLLPDVPPVPLDKPLTLPSFAALFSSKALLTIIGLSLLAWFAFKSWLRFGYLLVTAPKRRIYFAYVSFASLMADLRLYREEGETRKEYCERLYETRKIDARGITSLLEKARYAKVITHPASPDEALLTAARSFAGSRWKKLLAFVSPFSTTRLGSW